MGERIGSAPSVRKAANETRRCCMMAPGAITTWISVVISGFIVVPCRKTRRGCTGILGAVCAYSTLHLIGVMIVGTQRLRIWLRLGVAAITKNKFTTSVYPKSMVWNVILAFHTTIAHLQITETNDRESTEIPD